MYVNIDFILAQAGELECGRDKVLLRVFVKVHPGWKIRLVYLRVRGRVKVWEHIPWFQETGVLLILELVE